MLSQDKFQEIIQRLKEQKPYLFSLREDGSLEVNLFVLQEVLKQLGYQIKYTYYWKDKAYCIDFKLVKGDITTYETFLCKEGISRENTSFDYITIVEVSLLEKALTKTFREFLGVEI